MDPNQKRRQNYLVGLSYDFPHAIKEQEKDSPEQLGHEGHSSIHENIRRQEEHEQYHHHSLPKQSEQLVAEPSGHSFQLMVGQGKTQESLTQGEHDRYKMNRSQSLYQVGEGQKKASDNQQEVGVEELQRFQKLWMLYP